MKQLIPLLLFLSMVSESMSSNLVVVNQNSFVHMLCHSTVTYVQVGDPDILIAETLDQYPNVVRFKALKSFEGKSSLTIICGGQLYCFEVHYNNHSKLNLDIHQFQGEVVKATQTLTLPLDRLNASIEEMLYHKKRGNLTRVSKDNIEWSLDDVGIKNDLIFIRLTVVNRSNIIYKAGSPLFLMQDKKPKKAANRQEYPIAPVKVSDNQLMVPPGQAMSLIVVFHVFTIPSHKTVRIILKEESKSYTGRDLELKLTNKAIRKAGILKT